MKRLTSLILSAALCVGITGAYTSVSADGEELVLKESSKLVLDGDTGYVSRISHGTTKEKLISEFQTTDGIVVAKNGSELADSDIVSSGCVVTLGDESYTCAVTGDVNGDGKVNINDVSDILRYLASWNITVHVPAIDANLDGKDNILDASHLLKYLADWDVHVGVYDVIYSDEPIIAPSEDKNLSLSVLDNMQKIDQRNSDIGSSATIRMSMSRNEIESCLIYLASNGGHTDLNISFTPFNNGAGETIETELFAAHYVSSESVQNSKVQVQYPDAMIPVTDFDIKDGYSQCFLLKVKPGKDASSGLYESTVKISNSAGRIIKSAKVYAEIWNLTLSDDTACQTAFGLSRYNIYTSHKQYTGDDGELYKAYYEYMLENRMSAYHLPYEFSDPRVEDYIRDPRVTAFCVDGCQSPFALLTDEEISDLYDKYGDDEDWQEKAYFYYVDEPATLDACNAVKTSAERLQSLFPGARNVVPCYSNQWFGDIEQTEFLSDYINLWCPLSSFFTPYDSSVSGANPVYDKRTVDIYGTAEERFSSFKERGDELWWYVCVGPQYPYANLFVNYQGEMSRALFWQQYQYEASGFLYWSVNYWLDGREWRTADNGFYSGDGLLLYCGAKYGIRGPIGSLRIEYIRDGIEDFEYLTMAEELCGREAVNEVLTTVTNGILDYTKNSAVIENAKTALAEMIMEAGK